MNSQYNVLDIFAGAGGLGEGFSGSFNIASHVEMNGHAAKTLETRASYHAFCNMNREDIYYQYYNGNISREEFINESKLLGIFDQGIINKEISSKTEMSIINEIKERLKTNDLKKIDVIVGGPPCQAYSLIGRSRDPNNMRDDSRNELYLHYLKFIKEFEPEIFVFENVPGIKSAKDGKILSDFKKKINRLHYHVEFKTLNALNFGVLQSRNRIIFLGWKKEHKLEYPDFGNSLPKYKVWNLLNDLPFLEPGMGTDDAVKYRRVKPSKYLKESGIRTNEKKVRNHIARTHIERDRGIYRTAIERLNEDGKQLKYNQLDSELKTHKNQVSFLDRFKVVNGNEYSHSIVSHLSKDGHHFIHPDIKQARSLTVREAARIQSFPDNYIFEGPRTSQYVQIGNAVPPLMARGIANKIKEMLQEI